MNSSTDWLYDLVFTLAACMIPIFWMFVFAWGVTWLAGRIVRTYKKASRY